MRIPTFVCRIAHLVLESAPSVCLATAAIAPLSVRRLPVIGQKIRSAEYASVETSIVKSGGFEPGWYLFGPFGRILLDVYLVTGRGPCQWPQLTWPLGRCQVTAGTRRAIGMVCIDLARTPEEEAALHEEIFRKYGISIGDIVTIKNDTIGPEDDR